MSAWLIPFLIGFAFLTLFLITVRRRQAYITEHFVFETVQTKSFSFGQLTYYDNLNEKNKDQIPWIFIHSIGSSFFSWRYQIKHFSDSQRIIALDLLGFGQSDKPALQDYHLDATSERLITFFDSLEIKHGYLVGCSLGGALCLWLKKLQPERFLKVVAISPAATPSLVPFLRLQHEKLALIGKRLVSRPLIKAALRGGLAHRHKITADTVEKYFAPFMNPDAVTCFLKSVSIIKDARIYASLASLQHSVLILWGERDGVVPRAAITKIVAQLPQAQLLTHKSGGHHLMEDEPEWVNQAIFEYLNPLEG